MKHNDFEYRLGNRKIGRDTLIFNMSPAKLCASKELGLCQICNAGKICYARKSERQYPNVLPFRIRQMRYWHKHGAWEIMQVLEEVLKKHKKIRYVRFNESGDFSDQSDVEKLKIIARWNKHHVFYGYTARSDLDFTDRPKNLVMQGSGFMLDNAFIAVKEYSGYNHQCKGSCKACSLCKVAGNRIIENKYH